VEEYFETRIQSSAQDQHEACPKTDDRINTPIQGRHDQKEEQLIPEESEDLHGEFQPSPQALEEQGDVNFNLQ
jgi:hypothetical protein